MLPSSYEIYHYIRSEKHEIEKFKYIHFVEL